MKLELPQPASLRAFSHSEITDGRRTRAAATDRERSAWLCRGRALEDALNLRDVWMLELLCEPDFCWIDIAGTTSGRGAAIRSVSRHLERHAQLRVMLSAWAVEGSRCVFRVIAEAQMEKGLWRSATGLLALQTGRQDRLAYAHYSFAWRKIDEEQRLLFWPHGRRPGDHPNMTVLGI